MKKIVLLIVVITAFVVLTSCKDANEYGGADTNNPSWVTNWTDSTIVPHPETVANTMWYRGSGMKKNAYGEEVQGFVESLDFSADSVVVKMSEGCTPGTWVDDSNTESLPCYEYKYSEITGNVEILKQVKDDKGKVSKSVLFTGVIVIDGSQEIMTITHYGDTPIQTYLVKK